MTLPRRWIDEDATQAERQLLLSARDDAPNAAARERLFTALGVGSATALGVAAATATQLPNAAALAAGGAAALGKAAPGSAGVTALVIMKWVGVGAVAGLVTTGTVNLVSERAARARSVPAAAAPVMQAAVASRIDVPQPRPAPELTPEPVDLPAPPEPEEVAAAAAPAPNNGPRAQQRPPVERPQHRVTPNVGKEVATLDRAREALAAGDAPRALEALGQHDGEFASGALGPEAEVLRIEALLARGEHNSAAVMARGFLYKHSSSPHVRRVRSLLERAKAAQAPPGASE